MMIHRSCSRVSLISSVITVAALQANLICSFGYLFGCGRQGRVRVGEIPRRAARHVGSEESTREVSLKLNPVISSVKVSKTVEIFSLVKQMQADGISVTSLCVGEPDFSPFPAILDAACRAVRGGDTRYTAVTGTAALRNAISRHLNSRKGLDYDPDTQILVANGAKQCVFQGILATCSKGDQVLVPSPYWPSYPEMATLVGAETVLLPTHKTDGYLITPDALRTCLQNHPDVKLMILCDPSNPTGGVHSKSQLIQIARVLESYPNVVVLADEIYERLVYDQPRHVSFATMPNMFHRTITVNGFSKAYAMTGLRLGYMAAPVSIIRAATVIQSQLTSCASSISQAAGVAALDLVSQEEMDSAIQIMRDKRDFVVRELNSMDGVELEVVPNGAFYVLPDVSTYYGGDDVTLCLDLLKKKRLALVPGTAFGAPGTVRISYATSLEELSVAMDKFREFLAECSSTDDSVN